MFLKQTQSYIPNQSTGNCCHFISSTNILIKKQDYTQKFIAVTNMIWFEKTNIYSTTIFVFNLENHYITSEHSLFQKKDTVINR